MSNDTNCQTGMNRFERNNYFYGKLLTVRDMAAEQAYHTRMQRTLSRFVTDWGGVAGLDVESSVDTDTETDQQTLAVTVSEGLALDRCGRLVVVEDDQRRTLPVTVDAEGADPDAVAVYVEYDECFTDPVPVAKMETACEEECEDNRVVEDAEVTIEAGEPTDYRKSIADVEFPTAAELGRELAVTGQSLAIRGDFGASDTSDGEPNRVGLELALTNDAPTDTVVVDITPPQSSEDPVLTGKLAVPESSLFGDGGFQAPSGDFDITGTYGTDAREWTLSGSLAAEPATDGVSLEGPLVVDGPDEFEVDLAFTITRTGTGLDIDGSVSVETSTFLADGELDVATDDGRYVLSDTVTVSRETDEGPIAVGSVQTLPWEDADGDAVQGILVDRPVEATGTDRGDVDLDAVLSGLARSYYEDEPRPAEGDVTAGRVLVGILRSQGGTWDDPDFERGPLVYTNDMLFDILASHVADFDNPHEVRLGVDAGSGDGADAGIGVVESEGVTGPVGFTSADDTVDITPNRVHGSIDLSAPDAFSAAHEAYYVFEKSLWTKVETYSELVERAARYQVPQEVRAVAYWITVLAREALQDRVHESPADYYELLTGQTLPTGTAAEMASGEMQEAEQMQEAELQQAEELQEKAEIQQVTEVVAVEGYHMMEATEVEAEALPLLQLESQVVDLLTIDKDDPSPQAELANAAIQRVHEQAERFKQTASGAPALAMAQDRVAESVRVLLHDAPLFQLGMSQYEYAGYGATGSLESSIGRGVVPEVTYYSTAQDRHRRARTSISVLWRNGWVYEINEVAEDVDSTGALGNRPLNSVQNQSPAPGTRATKPETVRIDVVNPPPAGRVDEIGPGRSKSLAWAGIATVSELAISNPDVIRLVTGVTKELAQDIHEQARGYARAYDLTKYDQIGVEEAEMFWDVKSWSHSYYLKQTTKESFAEAVPDKYDDVLEGIDWDKMLASIEKLSN